ncbi:MAG TPA: hypothetical protein VFX28_21590, partial [Methylomirabilota bacterium]|nr:hypothetical protein [Methylomirabilota bacterium]
MRKRRGPRAALTLTVCVAVAVALLTYDATAGPAWPAWAVLAGPPLVYLLLAAALLRQASPLRKLAWAAMAGLTHATLGAVTATVYAWLVDLAWETALADAFWRSSAAAMVHAAGAALVTLPLRRRLLDWPSRPDFPRAAPSAAVSPAAGPRVMVAAAPGAAPDTPVVRRARVRAAVDETFETPDPAADPRSEDMLRIPFRRVAAQIPADAFLLPIDRVAESLREPHHLLVPRDHVVPQLAEGTVEVSWAMVADQFPALALAPPAAEGH